MAVPPASPVPTVSPAEIQILISRAGLVLNPGQVADLVLAWRQVAGLIAAMPHDRPLADDMAMVFRLPPPSGAVTEEARPRAVKPGGPAKAAAKASAKAAGRGSGRVPRKAPGKVNAKASAKSPARAPAKLTAKAAAAPKAKAKAKAPAKGKSPAKTTRPAPPPPRKAVPKAASRRPAARAKGRR